jgi:tetratricopeptide (TPR) repeat protein
MAVSLPAVLLILDWHPFRRIRSLKTLGAVFVEKLPFIACSLISSLLTILAQETGGATKLTEIVPFSTRLLVAAKALIVYLWKMVAPMNLIPFYPYPRDVSLLSPVYLGAVLLVVGITSISLIVAKRNRLWLALWGYYVVALMPVLGLVQVGGQSMADRYMYLPSLAPFLAVALATAWFSKNSDELKKHRLMVKVFGICAAILVFVSLSYLTFRQIGVWSSSVELWNYVIKKEPETALAYNNRGQAFLEKGELDNALADFSKVIALNQSYDTAYNNRGIVLSKTGHPDKAMEDFDKAIALNPLYDEAYNHRGIAFGEMGQLDKAMEDFNKTIALNPYHSRAYFNRGYVYFKRGNVESAAQNFQKACALGYEAACKAMQKIESSPP